MLHQPQIEKSRSLAFHVSEKACAGLHPPSIVDIVSGRSVHMNGDRVTGL